MNVRIREAGERSRQGRPIPLSGVWIVFRRQMRGRCAWRDLIGTGVMLGLLLAAAALLQRYWAGPTFYSNNLSGFLERWLLTSAVGAALLFPLCAAVLGAGAVPATAEFETTQAALLTRLTAFDLVCGRLMAALWPILSTLLASCAFWLGAQLGWRFLPGAWEGYASVAVVHLIALGSVLMSGGGAFLCATRLRPGRLWGRGAAAGLLLSAFCLTALFLFDKPMQKMPNPTRLLEFWLLLNPAAAIATELKSDFLRSADWIYNHTIAPEYAITNPPPLGTAGIMLAVGAVALSIAALRLRRAYR